MASIFKRKGEKRWTISYFDHEGRRREKASGRTDKRLAERLAAKMSDGVLERTRGLVDPVAERLATERVRPLSDHFADYAAHLATLQRDARHVESTMRYLRAVAGELGWVTLASLDARDLAAHLSERAEKRGMGARTFNATLTAWRAFGRWCAKAGRLAANPLAGIEARNLDADRRRVRRDMTPDGLARIIDMAERTPAVVVRMRMRNRKKQLRAVAATMRYPERAWAYRIAAGTGFRAAEVASLTPESFDLGAATPTVEVAAAYSKRKRCDVQPIRPDLAAMLRPWLKGKEPGKPVCPLPPGKAGLLLQADMAAGRGWRGSRRPGAQTSGPSGRHPTT